MLSNDWRAQLGDLEKRKTAGIISLALAIRMTKRRTYTLKEKLEVQDALQTLNQRDAAKLCGVPRRNVRVWSEKETSLREYTESALRKSFTKGRKVSKTKSRCVTHATKSLAVECA